MENVDYVILVRITHVIGIVLWIGGVAADTFRLTARYLKSFSICPSQAHLDVASH